MKRLIWILVLVVAGYLAYNYYVKSRSEEVRTVKDMETAYAQAEDRYIAALRESGGPGFEIISDPETAAKRIKEIRRELAGLIKTLKEEKAIARAQALEERILEFCRKNQIN